METAPESSATLAILIDADNARPSIVQGLMDEVAWSGLRLRGARGRFSSAAAANGSDAPLSGCKLSRCHREDV
jgi:hypothetical protein